jgi:hypothetical protein
MAVLCDNNEAVLAWQNARAAVQVLDKAAAGAVKAGNLDKDHDLVQAIIQLTQRANHVETTLVAELGALPPLTGNLTSKACELKSQAENCLKQAKSLGDRLAAFLPGKKNPVAHIENPAEKGWSLFGGMPSLFSTSGLVAALIVVGLIWWFRK